MARILSMTSTLAAKNKGNSHCQNHKQASWTIVEWKIHVYLKTNEKSLEKSGEKRRKAENSPEKSPEKRAAELLFHIVSIV